ncbi:hypothetical protein M2323_000473 [Rhodoblastus acidophilus]|uniref:hypothetical protein n=1 Tax=Rhodoblastus acidophilus TaxID=1074 RepID=UPI0022241B0C|nr:hypothetical protein [Rhodoblastus acidophilus]MCW2282712.1 hypothetical protein [Rhodoblastus acidophilus]MCW2331573.1 hypothetical protein [Rhodoblastus acidophilus]
MQEIVQKKKQYERLFAATYDFAQARFCARYLLKKKWHSRPWERRGSIYQQQTAFVTNLIIAYARPFTKSKGWPGFPLRLVNFSAEHAEMHKKILVARHEIFAHSDSRHFEFNPVKLGKYIATTIELVPFAGRRG